MYLSTTAIRNFGIIVAFTIATTLVQAQTKTPDYGGLSSYPVPASDGGPEEFRYCVVYAKRAWRVANLIDERKISISQAKAWARDGLGILAADEEIADYEKWEEKRFPSTSWLAAERFNRCLERLKLYPEPFHKENAEFCFRSITVLDFAARMRAEGKSPSQVKVAITNRNPKLPKSFVDSTIALAFSGESISENSLIIEDTFSSCFAEAGERKQQK